MQRPAFLSLALLLGLAVTQSNIAASEPGYLDFDNLPETNFSCEGKVIGGYYADVETGCQMFHVCTIGQKGEVTDIKFLCLNGTVFDQETRVCERIDEVDCSRSESFFGLNLELYGNHPAAQGIAPEDECEEECPTEPPFDEYEDEEIDSTTYTPQTTTTTRPTTTTSRATTTTHPPSTIPVPPPPQASFPSTSPETVAALLALHNAFTQSLNRHGKPAPPRVINNAFAPAETFGRPAARPPTFRTPAPTFGTTRRPDGLQFGERPKPADYIHGYPRHHFPLTTTGEPHHLRSNYQHFQSGDARFTHSLDADRPYNFQYFGHGSSPSPSPSPFSVRSLGKDAVAKAAVSVVTSTSSSTSVKTSRINDTSVDFPTGYDEYQDGEEIEDPFFRDVPKLPARRSKRDLPATHATTEPTAVSETPRHSKREKEEFLRNLLGSLDMKRQERRKLTEFFERAEPEMEKVIKTEEMDGFLSALQNEIGRMDLRKPDPGPTANSTDLDYDIGDVDGERLTTSSEYRNDESADWTIGINGTERVRRDAGARKFDETSSDLEYVESGKTSFEDKPQNKRQAVNFRQRRIDTEKFAPEYESERRRSQGRSRTPVEATTLGPRRRPGPIRPRPAVGPGDVRPVTEVIEDDVTTKEYRRANPARTRVGAAPAKVEGRADNSQYGRRPRTGFDSYETTTRAAYSPTRRRKIIHSPPRASSERPVIEPTEEPDGDTGIRTVPPTTVRHTTVPTTTLAGRELDSTPGGSERPSGRRLKTIEATTPYFQEKREGPGKVRVVNRRRGPPRPLYLSTQPPIEPPPPPAEDLREDPEFSCEGKIKGGYYADVPSACRGFFVCSQGEIDGPLLKTHFWCGTATKFNQRSRTCQADYLVECSISERYYHLNQDQLVPESEDQLRGDFEPSKL